MMKANVGAVLAGMIAVAGIAACAGGAAGADGKKKTAGANKQTLAEQSAVASGALTKDEAGLDCKRMAGRMQIRILELRGGGAKQQGSSAAQGLHSAVVPLFGGSRHGADAAGDAARDRTKLAAMNEILIARACPHYDLDGELKMGHDARTPRLIRSKAAGVKRAGKTSAASKPTPEKPAAERKPAPKAPVTPKP